MMFLSRDWFVTVGGDESSTLRFEVFPDNRWSLLSHARTSPLWPRNLVDIPVGGRYKASSLAQRSSIVLFLFACTSRRIFPASRVHECRLRKNLNRTQ